MNTCSKIIKSGINKNKICQRNIPCKYHKVNSKNKEIIKDNPRDTKTISSLFFMSEQEYRNYQHPNNWHPSKHTLDCWF